MRSFKGPGTNKRSENISYGCRQFSHAVLCHVLSCRLKLTLSGLGEKRDVPRLGSLEASRSLLPVAGPAPSRPPAAASPGKPELRGPSGLATSRLFPGASHLPFHSHFLIYNGGASREAVWWGEALEPSGSEFGPCLLLPSV